MGLLILVNGYPATGKTTLMHRLAKELHLPALSKDELKEWLHDTMSLEAAAWTGPLGKVSSHALLAVADAALAMHQTVMLENAYITEFARPDFQALLDKYEADILEIYCACSDETRLRRWSARVHNGERHEVHVDHDIHAAMTPAEVAARYGPLELGTILRYDTEHDSAEAFKKLCSAIAEQLKRTKGV